MSYAPDARKLADYIISLNRCDTFYKESTHPYYNHLGALLTDIILQAGLNYNSVVKPRIRRILLTYPYAITRPTFQETIDKEGLENVIMWKHYVKVARMRSILEYVKSFNINTCAELRLHLTSSGNRQLLLNVKGIGPKTIDYLMKLLNFDAVAVDRHIYSFLKNADIEPRNYHTAQKIVEYAADFLEVRRSVLDYSIWSYMSSKRVTDLNRPQLTFDF